MPPIPRRHAATLAWARKHLGEREHPDGSNTGPFVLECQRATWLGGTRWPWCAAFVVKGWRQAGFKLPYLGASAYAMLAWYRAHLPGWVVPLEKARPGAAVVFNIGAGHVALLAKPYAQTKPNVVTVGGNEGNAVREVTRHHSLVRGVVDPPEAGTAPTPKPPLWEIATSASGHSKLLFVGGKSQVARRLAVLFNRYGGLTVRRRK